METLFLAHRIPFPPDRGDKIRSHHLLRALAALGPVHVGTFAQTAPDRAAEAELAQLAASHCLADRRKPLPLAGLEALARGEPVSLAAFRSARLARWVRDLLARRRIGAIVVFSGQMAHYVPRDFVGRVVADLCDVDSAKFEAYGRAASGPRAFIDRREGRLLAREEERIAHRADTTLLVSAEEAALFRSRLRDPSGTDIRALRNGIDTDLFDPATVAPHPDPARAEGPQLVFTGQMDYPPNIAAALRAMDRILPAIRARHPHARFHVVGRAPVAALRDRDGRGGVRVWGAVPDIRPFLAAADAVLAPLDLARGIQNKVLEAMAMARPVVVSPEAATGIDGRDGHHWRVAADDSAFIATTLELLADRQTARAMGQAARDFVRAHQAWPAMLAPLAEIVTGRGARDAA